MVDVRRRLGKATFLFGLAAAIAAAGITVWLASPSARSAPRASVALAPPSTITATRIRHQSGTLFRGSPVPIHDLVGVRAFPTSSVGFSLATVGEADYAAVTRDGGATWQTDSPALHLHAAQAPLVVTNIGAAGRRTVFAFGGGQTVDTTRDGGRHWWRAVLGDVVLAVVAPPGTHRLVAVAQDATGVGDSAVTFVYVSRDGGRTWHLNSRLGAF